MQSQKSPNQAPFLPKAGISATFLTIGSKQGSFARTSRDWAFTSYWKDLYIILLEEALPTLFSLVYLSLKWGYYPPLRIFVNLR